METFVVPLQFAKRSHRFGLGNDSAPADDPAGSRVLTEKVDHPLGSVHAQIGRGTHRDLVPFDAEHSGGLGCDHVEQPELIGPTAEVEQMGGQEGDLEHVVPAVGVVGVLDVVLPERDGYPGPVELPHRKGERAGMGIGDEPQTGPFGQPHEPQQCRLWIEARRPGMAGDAAAHQIVPKYRRGQHLGGAQRGIARIVDEHRDAAVGAFRERAGPLHVLERVRIGVFDPGDSTDDVGAQLEPLPRTAPPHLDLAARRPAERPRPERRRCPAPPPGPP